VNVSSAKWFTVGGCIPLKCMIYLWYQTLILKFCFLQAFWYMRFAYDDTYIVLCNIGAYIDISLTSAVKLHWNALLLKGT
jgi:hypothetical protein